MSAELKIREARELAFSMTHSAGQWMVPGWDGYKVAVLLESLCAELDHRRDAAAKTERNRATPAPGAPGQEAAAVQAVGAWQDIATAPKDGTECLLYTKECGRVVAYWDLYEEPPCWRNGFDESALTPTAYAPLLERPAALPAGAGEGS